MSVFIYARPPLSSIPEDKFTVDMEIDDSAEEIQIPIFRIFKSIVDVQTEIKKIATKANGNLPSKIEAIISQVDQSLFRITRDMFKDEESLSFTEIREILSQERNKIRMIARNLDNNFYSNTTEDVVHRVDGALLEAIKSIF